VILCDVLLRLQSISLVGNSLGGLYARHAIRLLYTPDAPANRVVAGLEPETFMVRAYTCVPLGAALGVTASRYRMLYYDVALKQQAAHSHLEREAIV
jgi:Putative serine esterase (DUF676)